MLGAVAKALGLNPGQRAVFRVGHKRITPEFVHHEKTARDPPLPTDTRGASTAAQRLRFHSPRKRKKTFDEIQEIDAGGTEEETPTTTTTTTMADSPVDASPFVLGPGYLTMLLRGQQQQQKQEEEKTPKTEPPSSIPQPPQSEPKKVASGNSGSWANPALGDVDEKATPPK